MPIPSVNEILTDCERNYDAAIGDIKTLLRLADTQLAQADIFEQDSFIALAASAECLLDEMRCGLILMRKALNLPEPYVDPELVLLEVDNAA